MGAPHTAFDITRRAAGLSVAQTRSKPAPWRDIPEDAISFSARFSIAAPAQNVLTNVATYIVQRGFRACLSAIFNFYDGNGFVSGMGVGVTWQISVNTPITGAIPGTGRFVKDYDSITSNLGSFTNGPWLIDQGVNNRFEDGDILRYNVTIAAANLAGQIGAIVTCMLIGWTWPVERLGRDGE